MTSRDIQEFAQLSDGRSLTRLLSLAAARSGGLLVYEDLARGLGVSGHTARTYLSYLETVFLSATVPAWATNATLRVTRLPSCSSPTAVSPPTCCGSPRSCCSARDTRRWAGWSRPFVYTELLKAQARTDGAFEISHLRDRDGREVDFVCEGPDGNVVAIEVNSSTSPRPDADRHLRWLRNKLGDRFVAGVVRYLGEHSYSLGDRIMLLPVSAIWEHGVL